MTSPDSRIGRKDVSVCERREPIAQFDKSRMTVMTVNTRTVMAAIRRTVMAANGRTVMAANSRTVTQRPTMTQTR